MSRLLLPLVGLISAALPLLIDSALKGAALLVAAGVVTLALPKASAATRHLVWLFAAGALLVLPVLSVLLPDWRVLPAWTAVAVPAVPAPDVIPPTLTLVPAAPDPAPARAPSVATVVGPESVPSGVSEPALTPGDWLPLAWIAGAALLVIRMLAAHWFLRQVSRECTETTEGRLAQALKVAQRQLAIDQPVQLLIDSRRTIPMVWGLFRPRVLLPAEAQEWSDSQLRSVLLHELAHIKRRDVAVQWLLQLACALHWFNPLIWITAWRLHVEAERACDDLVLASGVRASDYAEHLLHVATKLTPAHRAPACGLAMAKRSRLEGRLVAVLNGRLNRHGMTRALALGALVLVAGVTIPVAMLRARAETPNAQNAAEGTKTEAPAVASPVADQKPSPPEFSSVPASPWTATGRVTDADGKPLAEAEIWVHAGMGTLRRTGVTKTGDDGRYAVSFGRGILMPKDDPNLQYAQVTAHKTGFFEKNLNRHGGRAAALREVPAKHLKSYGITVEQIFLPDKPQTIDFVMMPAARIKGRFVGTGAFPSLPPTAYRARKGDQTVDTVTLEQAPLATWRVWLVGKELPPGSSVLASAETDANGEFVFESVPTGFTWQFQADTHRQQPEPKSAPFKLGSAGEATFELEIPEDQKAIRLLQAPDGRVQNVPDLNPANEQSVEISETGKLSLAGRPMSLEALMNELAREQRAKPDLAVTIRAAKNARMEPIILLLDSLKQLDLGSVRFATPKDDSQASARSREESSARLQEIGREEFRQARVKEELKRIRADAARVKLQQAKAELDRVKQLHDASLVSEHELKRAEFAVKISEAELRGDPLEVSRIQLKQAEDQLARISQLREINFVSEEEYSQAAATVEMLKAKLAGNETEVARIKLRHAEGNLKRLTELHKARLISQQQFNRAQLEVRLSAAELKGDAAEVARVRQEFTEAELKRATELRKQNLISEEEFQKAKAEADKAKGQ